MYIDTLKLFFKMDNTSLYEEITSTYASDRTGETSPSVVGGYAAPLMVDDGMGYVMQNNQYFLGDGISNNGYNLGGVTSTLTIGYWLYPVNYGLVTNPTTGAAESISMPLIKFLKSSNDNIVLEVEEHTASGNENYLTVSINAETYVATSENYDAGLWHLIWIVYRGTSLSVYIDGKLQTLTESGPLPGTIDVTLVDFYINHSSSYNYKRAKNNGYIDDIFILSDADSNLANIQKVVNRGVESIVDTDFNIRSIDSYGIYYNDPTTITITSFIDDMSYVYIGRNDGIIMRGSPLFWEARKVYSDKDEENLLSLTAEQAANNGVSDGFLEIKSIMVRL